jgi:PIN domain nuclease of toxin-antitoxin system
MRHAIRVDELPPLHRDPFDRMLTAQALAEEMALISGDARVARYPVTVLW